MNSLVGVACAMHQKVASSFPGQGTYLGCGFDSLSGHSGRQLIDVSDVSVSLSPQPLPSPSLKSINLSSGEDFLKIKKADTEKTK